MTKQKILLVFSACAIAISTMAMASQFGLGTQLRLGNIGSLLGSKPTTNTAATNTTNSSSAQAPTTNNRANAATNDGHSTDLNAMLAAFDKILHLTEVQKDEVNHQNEKTFERIAEVKQREGVDNTWKEHEIARLKAFRDKRIATIFQAAQTDKWERFVQGKEAINSLKKTNERKIPYERGEKKFYPESEYGEFTSLEQIKEIIADKEAIISASGFSATEIEQLYSIIYQFN